MNPTLIPCPSIGPKWLWTVQIVLIASKLFWSGPNCFGQVQIILVRFKLYFSGLIFIIWTWPKWIGPVQNDWYSTKIIWTVHNHFGPIEGQGISHLYKGKILTFRMDIKRKRINKKFVVIFSIPLYSSTFVHLISHEKWILNRKKRAGQQNIYFW